MNNRRWRVVVEELEQIGEDDPVWALSLYRRRGAKWIAVGSPNFYPTHSAALTTARDWIAKVRREEGDTKA